MVKYLQAKRWSLAVLMGGLAAQAGASMWASSVIVTLPSLTLEIEVTSPLDEADLNPADGICQTASGECSLRAAIQTANAKIGPDVINLGDGFYELTVENANREGAHDEDAAAFGDLDVRSQITINGAGADVVAIDGGMRWRVFDVHDHGQLTLNNLTIRGGDARNEGNSGGTGGGMRVAGFGQFNASATLNRVNVVDNMAVFGGGVDVNPGRSLTVNLSNIKRNETMSQGGGIHNNMGRVVIQHSHISDNKMFGGINLIGGGIYNVSTGAGPIPGSLKIEHSTISGNEALFGGGLAHFGGPLQVHNTTFSDNEAWSRGGAIYHQTNAGPYDSVFRHVTIAHNRALGEGDQHVGQPVGAAIFNGEAKISLLNSLLAFNGALGQNCSNVNDGTIDRVGTLITDGSCLNNGEVREYAISEAELGPLRFNGGPTLTHALLAVSGFSSADPNYGLFLDQRGYARRHPLDVGAVNRTADAPSVVVLPTPEYAGPTPEPENTVPVAFGMPLAMQPGRVINSVATAVDNDGDLLEYFIVDQPTQGVVGFDDMPFLKAAFTYRANQDASGRDSFSFKACDRFSCSAPATISIAFMGPADQLHSIELRVESGGVASEFQVVSPGGLEAVTADDNFSRPFGVFYFDVNDIPATSDVTQVVIQLSGELEIAENAVVRKLDVHNVWHTLMSGSDPSRSTATIDPVAKTITLNLRDNDMFDFNPAVGVIRDPVALAVPVLKQTDSVESEESSGGGGGVWLWMLAITLMLRRWSCWAR